MYGMKKGKPGDRKELTGVGGRGRRGEGTAHGMRFVQHPVCPCMDVCSV